MIFLVSKTEGFFDGKTLFFVQTSPPPFLLYFFSFEAFPHLGKDSAQNFLQAISQSVVEVFKCWFYNYKYQNVLSPLRVDLFVYSVD